MLLQTGNADVSQIFDDDEPTVEKATLDAHIAEVFWIDLIFKLKYYSIFIFESRKMGSNYRIQGHIWRS